MDGSADLDLGVLDRITGGAYMPEWQRAGRESFQRNTFISSSYSMPIAQAFAVCFMCSASCELTLAALMPVIIASGLAVFDAGLTRGALVRGRSGPRRRLVTSVLDARTPLAR